MGIKTTSINLKNDDLIDCQQCSRLFRNILCPAIIIRVFFTPRATFYPKFSCVHDELLFQSFKNKTLS